MKRLLDDLLTTGRDKLQHYLDLVGVVIVILDREGNVSVVNKRGCDVIGYDMDDIIGKNCFDNFISGSLRESAKTIFNQVVSGEIEPVEYYKTPILTKSGDERTIFWHNDVIRDNDGTIIYAISSGDDITDMLTQQNALRESEEKFKAVFEQAIDPIFIIDAKNGTILMFNDSAHKLYGYTREEFEHIHISDFEVIESPEETLKHMKKVEDYGSDSFETMQRTKDGRILYVHVNVRNVIIDGKSYHMAIARDITRVKKIESELIMRTKQLEEMNRTLETKVQEQIDKTLAKERILMQQSKIAADAAVVQSAAILESHGHIEESIEQILKIRKWKLFEELILNHVQNLIDEGSHTAIDKWFSAIPYEIMRDYPRLMYWQGVNRMYLNPGDARMILETAYAVFKPLDKVGQLSALCAVIKTYLLERTDFHPLDYWIAEFEESLIEVSTNSVTLREAVASSIAPALMFRRPAHKDIDYWVAEAETAALNSNRIETRMFAGYNLITYYLWSGSISKAGVIVDRLSLQIRETKTYPMLRLLCFGVESTYWVWRADYKKAIQTDDEGLSIARHTGLHFILTASVFASLAVGEDNAAGKYQKTIMSYMENVQPCPAVYYQTASLIEASKGAFPFAIEYAEKWLDIGKASGCQQLPAVHRFVLAYVLAEAGRYDDAMLHIDKMVEVGAASKSRLFDNWAYAIKSLIALKTNIGQMFEEMFDNYVRSAKVTGLRYLLPLQKSVAMICKAAIEREIQTDYVKELITSHHIKSDGHTIEDWPWAIKIYTLGRFEIFTKDGNILKSSGKPHKIPMLLLKSIITHGGRHVGAEMLSDHLWPDSDGDTSQNLFSTNIHRLRKLLGGKDIIQHIDGQLDLNPELCWVDIWAFDDVTGKIYNIIHQSTGDAEALMPLFVRMCSLYKGDFIPGNQTDPSSTQMRNKLMRMFIDTCLQAGKWLERHNKWEHAAECYKSALLIYNSEEILYQRLMKCFQTIGRSAEVISTYNTCRDALISTLGLEPSNETKAFYNSVNNNPR